MSPLRPKFRPQVLLEGVRTVAWTFRGDPDRTLALPLEVVGVRASSGRVLGRSVEEIEADDDAGGFLLKGRPVRDRSGVAGTVRRSVRVKLVAAAGWHVLRGACIYGR